MFGVQPCVVPEWEVGCGEESEVLGREEVVGIGQGGCASCEAGESRSGGIYAECAGCGGVDGSF